jgi:flagellar hook-associated protein 3 FlgL
MGINRISTALLHQQGVAAMQLQQAKLAKVQQQLATGARLTRAADDPAAASSAVALDQALAELNRFGENAKTLTHKLQLEEGALAGVEDVLMRVRELAVTVNNGSYTDTERAAIAAELRQRLDDLVGLANSGDGTGRHLFGGTQDGAAPFTGTPPALAYGGDSRQRLITVAPGVDLADGDPGDAVFLNVPGGTDVFSAVANLIAAVEIPGNTPAANAARQAGYAAAQDQLAAAVNHVSDTRARVGARLNAADTAQSQREAAALDVQTTLSGFRDLDYAEAVSRMNLLLTALQAAQATYQRVQGSSLFDYLR